MNAISAVLMALTVSSSLGLGPASAASHAAIITGEVHNPPSREVAFHHEPLLAPGPSEHTIALDEQNRFALLLNISQGAFVSGYYGGYFSIPFFVEPGDSLHVVATFAEGTEADSYMVVTFAEGTEADSAAAVESDSLDSAEDEAPPYSLTFSGRGADNNRFLAEFWPQHNAFDPDNGLEPEEFVRQVKQRRQDEFAMLAEGREQYALSPGFIDYMTAFFNYKWADLMISYPMFAFRDGHWVRRFHVKPADRRAVPPDYYDFLQEIPLIDEKAIGVREYRWFVVNALDLEMDNAEEDRPYRLADMYKLSGLGLSESVHARLDSMYAAYNHSHSHPKLSQQIDLAGVGLTESEQAQLDSIYEYEHHKKISASEKAAWLGLELSPTEQAELNSYKDYATSHSREDTVRIDTTGGELTFYIPLAKINEWYDYLNNRPLSARIDLSSLELSEAVQAQLDSLYFAHQNRPPLKLSERIDLAALGLSEATQAQLDSIFAGPSFPVFRRTPERYDLSPQRLQGRVLYWSLARELMLGISIGSEAFVDARWPSFKESNPFPEYTEALQAELDKLSMLQPGQPAPDFALHDLDGQPVSLSQFKGKVVLLDFWASWCGPCIADLPNLRKIKGKMAAQPVVFLNVSLDANEAAWKQAIAKHAIKGVHVRSNQVAQAYNVSGIPRYYLVDPQGLIVEDNLWVSDVDEVVAKIEGQL